MVGAPKKLVYLGSDGIGLRVLQWLFNNAGSAFRLVGIVSGLDKKHGRGLRLQANPITAWARENNIPLLQPEHPKEEIFPWMHTLGADAGIVFAYGCILPKALLDGIPFGFFNLHPSLLPEFRGPSPIESAILQRKTQTGVSLMRLVPTMDAGPIYAATSVNIGPRETTPTLREKVSQAAKATLEKHLADILCGKLTPLEQDHAKATFTKLIQKSDGLLDFKKPARELEAQIRAHTPWPGSFFTHKGELTKVGHTEWSQDNSKAPAGTILGTYNGALEIATANGILRVFELQLPTKQMQSIIHCCSF
ncbi:MAG: methionyl-tRNA formyltransferase [Puniceicoccales bacterium]|nr:methionyl-tRNA formyltransferase [Puniceicoccales bacterium]